MRTRPKRSSRSPTEKDLKLTAGHDDQFSHVARRMRALVEGGYLGGAPVHMESYYCYDLSEPGYAKALLGDRQHWVRRLPGKLLHNIISHGIAQNRGVPDAATRRASIAHGFVSPLLKRWASTRSSTSSGSSSPTTSARPPTSRSRRRCARRCISSASTARRTAWCSIRITKSLIKLRGGRFKSYAEKFVPPLIFAGQHLGNLVTNVQDVPGARLPHEVRHEVPDRVVLPLDRRSDGRCRSRTGRFSCTARIMDDIFEQLAGRAGRPAGLPALREPPSLTSYDLTDLLVRSDPWTDVM